MLRALGPQRNREIEEADQAWGKLRDRLYRLFLGSFKEVQEAYRSLFEEGADPRVVSVVSQEKGRNEKAMAIETRELELWKPLFALASFFEGYGSKGLTKAMHSLAEDTARQRLVENATESMDVLLAQGLRDLVTEDVWYSTRDIREALEKTYGEEPPEWLNAKWIGRAMKRLGFREKQRRGAVREYRLMPKAVEDLLKRLGLSTETSLTSLTTQTAQTIFASVPETEAENKEKGKEKEREEGEGEGSPRPRLPLGERPVFFYRPITSSSPSEPCELCGTRPVEYELEMPGEGILRRCGVCLAKLRVRLQSRMDSHWKPYRCRD
ncbi:MAG: hypothetical protein QXI39_06670 [Candidatus Bathyarchaeia archaeon]